MLAQSQDKQIQENLKKGWAKWREVKEILDQGYILGIDGGTGTELERKGAKMNQDGWSCCVQLNEPNLVKEVHTEYLQAGADIVIANTYANNRNILEPAGLGHKVEESNGVGVKLAKEAVAEFVDLKCNFENEKENGFTDWSRLHKPMVCGSISTHPPKIPPGCETYDSTDEVDACPWPKDPEIEESNYEEQGKILAKAGCDVIFLELMKNSLHGTRAIRGASKVGIPIFIGIASRLEDGEVYLWDPTYKEPIESVINEWLAFPNVVGINVMHTKIPAILPTLKIIRKYFDGPIGCYPDFGKFTSPKWQFEPLSPSDLVKACSRFVDEADASMFGGCCGIGPAAIEAISQYRLGHNIAIDKVRQKQQQQQQQQKYTLTNTHTHTV